MNGNYEQRDGGQPSRSETRAAAWRTRIASSGKRAGGKRILGPAMLSAATTRPS